MNVDRKLVTVRRISDLKPIEGADFLELATIDGWCCVVNKGKFKVGDDCLYFEVDSLLPMLPQFEFLKSRGTKKMMVDQKETEGYRLRTIRLRGALSQGLALPLTDFPEVLPHLFRSDMLVDLASILGVIKYEQPIPAQLQGMIKGNFPEFIEKTDQERVQNLTKELKSAAGLTFEVTEKLDGSSMTVYLKDGEFGVCSRNLELKESEGNTFWRVAREMDLENKLRAFGKNVALQGELVGPGIQGNPYRLSGATCYFFNVYAINERASMLPAGRTYVLTELGLRDKMVPVLFESFGLSNEPVKDLLARADGESHLCPAVKREGLVFNSNQAASQWDHNPFHFKVISNSFLLDEK